MGVVERAGAEIVVMTSVFMPLRVTAQVGISRPGGSLVRGCTQEPGAGTGATTGRGAKAGIRDFSRWFLGNDGA